VRALNTLREDLGEREHLSTYRLVAGSDTIYLADSDHAVDLLRSKGSVVIVDELVDVLPRSIVTVGISPISSPRVPTCRWIPPFAGANR